MRKKILIITLLIPTKIQTNNCIIIGYGERKSTEQKKKEENTTGNECAKNCNAI